MTPGGSQKFGFSGNGDYCNNQAFFSEKQSKMNIIFIPIYILWPTIRGGHHNFELQWLSTKKLSTLLLRVLVFLTLFDRLKTLPNALKKTLKS
jgi:hypothetical protein